MEKEKIFKEREKVFEKLIKEGFNTDKKIIDLKVEDLLQQTDFNRSELTIAIGIKNALVNKRLVSFLCGNDLVKEERREK